MLTVHSRKVTFGRPARPPALAAVKPGCDGEAWEAERVDGAVVPSKSVWTVNMSGCSS